MSISICRSSLPRSLRTGLLDVSSSVVAGHHRVLDRSIMTAARVFNHESQRSELQIHHLDTRHQQQRSFSCPPPQRNPATVGAAVRKVEFPITPRKAALTLTEAAVKRLRVLLSDPSSPKMLRIGTRKKGCSGQAYTLDYITEPLKFDEVIHQDGVTVVVESKALFSLIGSEMDYVEDPISSQFVFNNPNVKEMCGCGQSFMT